VQPVSAQGLHVCMRLYKFEDAQCCVAESNTVHSHDHLLSQAGRLQEAVCIPRKNDLASRTVGWLCCD
jgi:hypothetical protein